MFIAVQGQGLEARQPFWVAVSNASCVICCCPHYAVTAAAGVSTFVSEFVFRLCSQSAYQQHQAAQGMPLFVTEEEDAAAECSMA
jgi:hypothetical protein